MELKTIRIQRVVEKQNLASVMKSSYTANDRMDGRGCMSMPRIRRR